MRWIADWSVVAGKGQFACVVIDSEHRHIVRSLVAHIEELARGIEIEAAGIVSMCPFFSDELQLTAPAY